MSFVIRVQVGYGKGYILPNKHEMTLQEETHKLLPTLFTISLPLPLQRLIASIKSKLGLLADIHYCSQTLCASEKEMMMLHALHRKGSLLTSKETAIYFSTTE